MSAGKRVADLAGLDQPDLLSPPRPVPLLPMVNNNHNHNNNSGPSTPSHNQPATPSTSLSDVAGQPLPAPTTINNNNINNNNNLYNDSKLALFSQLRPHDSNGPETSALAEIMNEAAKNGFAPYHVEPTTSDAFNNMSQQFRYQMNYVVPQQVVHSDQPARAAVAVTSISALQAHLMGHQADPHDQAQLGPPNCIPVSNAQIQQNAMIQNEQHAQAVGHNRAGIDNLFSHQQNAHDQQGHMQVTQQHVNNGVQMNHQIYQVSVNDLVQQQSAGPQPVQSVNNNNCVMQQAPQSVASIRKAPPLALPPQLVNRPAQPMHQVQQGIQLGQFQPNAPQQQQVTPIQILQQQNSALQTGLVPQTNGLNLMGSQQRLQSGGAGTIATLLQPQLSQPGQPLLLKAGATFARPSSLAGGVQLVQVSGPGQPGLLQVQPGRPPPPALPDFQHPGGYMINWNDPADLRNVIKYLFDVINNQTNMINMLQDKGQSEKV